MAFEKTVSTRTLKAAGIAPIPGASLGTYATYEDFLARFQSLETTQISQAKISNPVEPDRSRVDIALQDASGTIDSYLRARYAKSIALLHNAPPTEIIRHCCNIARYFLAQNRPTDTQREMYEDAIRWCEFMLKDGRSLVTSDGSLINQDGTEGDFIDAGGDVVRDEAYSSNRPLFTSTASQVHRRQSMRNGGRGRFR